MVAEVTALRINTLSLTASIPSPSGPCFSALYAPCYVRGGDTEFLFGQGGRIDDGASDLPIGHPARTSDKAWLSKRFAPAPPAWPVPQLAFSGAMFPHMLSAAYLNAHPESAIGCVAGPQIAKLGDVWHAVFAASYNDLGLHTGEHSGMPEGKPWPMFALYMAQSLDGERWSLVGQNRDHSNEALKNAVVYFDAKDEDYAGGLKGFAMPHSLLMHEDRLHVFAEFWAGAAPRNVLLRLGPKAHPSPQQSDDVWSIYNGGGGWDEMPDGRLPHIYAEDVWHGNPYAFIVSHAARTNVFPGYKFILLAQGAGMVYGGRGVNNCVNYALSKDMIGWEDRGMITTDIPTLNGKGADNIALNPHYAEIDGKPWLFVSTSDRNGDGVPDCMSKGMSEYFGIGVMQGELTVA